MAKYDNIGGAVRGGRQILGMALDAIRGGDEAVAAVKPAKSVARKALDEIADAADDWGWKGGKPGEITGGEWYDIAHNGEERAADEAAAAFDELGYQSADDAYDDIWYGEYGNPAKTYAEELSDTMYATAMDNARKQFSSSKYANIRDAANSDQATREMLDDFAELERADIPRAWTGKIQSIAPVSQWNDLPAFGSFVRQTTSNWGSGTPYVDTGEAAKAVSDLMRPMTNNQRETFLMLLPQWHNTLDDLANAARKL